LTGQTHIVVLPGGGYRTYGARETEPIAEWLETLGIVASVFRYPINARHPEPQKAIRAEIARVRADGAERVGLIGFSAGGHAAALAALAPTARPDERVDFVVVGYPVVSMHYEGDSNSVTRDTLIGDDASAELRAETSPDRLVTPDAPPFFVWHTASDDVISVEHSYLLCASLARAGVSHELHVFERGYHGLGLAFDEPAAALWPELCRDWLARHRVIGAADPVSSGGQIQ
jgi:acetyl esterase/lipase